MTRARTVSNLPPLRLLPGGTAARRCLPSLVCLWVLASAPALAAPDLLVGALVVSPPSGPNGTTVLIEATVHNQGDAEAAESVTRFRINQSAQAVSANDEGLCSTATPVIAAGASVVVECTKKLTLRPAGANYVWAIADVNKEIGQVETDNDRRSALFTVDGNQSDLVIDGIEVDPVDAANGDELTVTVGVRNQGESDSFASTTRVRISESSEVLAATDPVLCNLPTPVIAPGEVVDVECVDTVSSRPPGTNYVWAIADVNRQAGQVDTSNDRANTPIEVSDEASDLVVDSVVVDPATAPPGEEVEVTVQIRNQGTRAASSSVTRIRINQNPDSVSGADAQICQDIQTSSINAGAGESFTCNATVPERPAGLHYVWAIADAGGTAGQSDRTNDRTRTEFVVEPPLVSDLVVRTLTVNPTSGPNGTQVTVTARIANEGEAVAAGSKTRFLINADPNGVTEGDVVLCDQVSTVALSIGASVQVSCKLPITGRPYGINRVWAVADATATSGQTNTANDTRSAPYDVLAPPAPDLVVEGLGAEPSAAEPGRAVSISARIRNQGTLPAPASTVRIQVGTSPDAVQPADSIVCSSLPVSGLAAGADDDVACNWNVNRTPGAAVLWATADAGGSAGQIRTDNDTRSLPFEVLVPDGPNLAVKRLVVRPTSARNGARVIVKARVLNKGNEPAAASATTFRINQDGSSVDGGDEVLCEDVPTRALPVDDVVTVRCEAVIQDRPIGAHLLWATADTTQSSGDVDPRDDSRRAPFQVVDVVCGDTGAPQVEWPVEEPRVLQDYASYGSVPLSGGRLGYHSGVDLVSQLSSSPSLSPVYAAADGEVVAFRKNCPSPADPLVNPPNGRCAGGWGNFVIVRHGGQIYTAYAHLGAVFVGKGCVESGQLLALAGSSGTTGLPVHVHFGVLADLVEPIARQSLGAEHYRRYHPLDGHVPENEGGAVRQHLDPRDFMTRSRVRITGAVAASRGRATGGVAAYLAAGQEYVSYGEIVPGYVVLDLPYGTPPEDGPPYADDARYGWVPVSSVEVLATGAQPGSLRIDGYGLFADGGIGASFVSVRDAASSGSAEVTKAYGNQQFGPAGAPVAENGNGRLWQAIDVPGTTATGASGPREAFVPLDATSE